MAPKKKLKQVASSSSDAFDSTRFWNEEAAAFHAAFIKKSMPRERGFDMSHPEYAMMLEAKRKQWDEFIQSPPDAVKTLAREFYANLKVRHENFKVLVRGKMVGFDSHAINTLYNMPDIEEDDYSKYMAEDRDYSEIISELCHEGVRWRTTNDAPITFVTSDMYSDARQWLYFVAARLMPSSHTSEVTKDRASLVYAIVKRKFIDVGKIITASILHAVSGATTGGLPHSSLITELCQRVGVTWDRGEDLLPVFAPLVVGRVYNGVSNREHERRKSRRVASSRQLRIEPAPAAIAPRTDNERLDLFERQQEAQNHRMNAFMDYMVNFTTVLAQRFPSTSPEDPPFPSPPSWPPHDAAGDDDH